MLYQIKVTGTIQGVGFRPFICQLAHKLQVLGFVQNTGNGVLIEAQANEILLNKFISHIKNDLPSLAFIETFEINKNSDKNYCNFEIRSSEQSDKIDSTLLPDSATCKSCITEIFDKKNRRYKYPFTTCTLCGPRFSILHNFPFDRQNTSMLNFTMCQECLAEYQDPQNKRFHSQTNACANCGPQLSFIHENQIISSNEEALKLGIQAIKEGKILALKGLGGFQLIADARNNDAIMKLRQRKRRPEKPFALMLPKTEDAYTYCILSETEKNVLESSISPIVLLRKNDNLELSELIAPKMNLLGVMLPYTPLHHLLLSELNFPVIATSGNKKSEPICIHNEEAFEYLTDIADVFLVHNRNITHGLDDSIVRVINNRAMVFRRARGYCPISIPLNSVKSKKSFLALGGYLKNTVALSSENKAYLTPYLGDLDNVKSCINYEMQVNALQKLYSTNSDYIACDLHPDYYSSLHAQKLNKNILMVQHHCAHILSCLADNNQSPPALGVAWDGSGFGLDHHNWGGEFILFKSYSEFERVGTIRPFSLIGGDKAAREPKRSALGILFSIFGKNIPEFWHKKLEVAFPENLLNSLLNVLDHTQETNTSIGRLFDAAAFLIGIQSEITFEGQAAMQFECLAEQENTNDTHYSIEIDKYNSLFVLNWKNTFLEFLNDIENMMKPTYKAHNIQGIHTIAKKFHKTLAIGISELIKNFDENNIALTGGVFQNKVLTELTIRELKKLNKNVLCHKNIPPNDGGIAIGQLLMARELIERSETCV